MGSRSEERLVGRRRQGKIVQLRGFGWNIKDLSNRNWCQDVFSQWKKDGNLGAYNIQTVDLICPEMDDGSLVITFSKGETTTQLLTTVFWGAGAGWK